MTDGPIESSCVFCRIVAGEEPAHVLRVTDTVVAFRDLNPQAPTHVLIVPKEHLVSLAEVEDRHGGMLADVAQSAAQIARTEGVDASGWRLVANAGRDAGQSVFHLHFHLLGGRRMHWPPG